MIVARTSLCAAALAARLALSPSRLPGQDPAAVWVTTDPARVAGCAPLGILSFPDPKGLDLLRGEAVRLGANVVRLTRLSDRGIAAELYQCGTSPAAPASISSPNTTASPTSTPVSSPTSTPAAPPTATPAPAASRRSSRKTPIPPSTAERQRAAHEELESLKAAIAVVSDLRDVEGCEKRGDRGAAGTTEDALRETAVGSLANVILIRRAEGGSVSGESYRCPRAQYQRLLAATPLPGR